MAAIVRFAGWTPNDVDPLVPAASDKGLAPEISAVVGVNGFRQPGDRPGGVDFALLQPRCLVVNGVKEAKADRKPGRGIHRKVETSNHSREYIDGQRQPWPLERNARFLMDDDQIDEGVIDLNDLEWPRGLVLIRNRGRRLDGGNVLPFSRR